MKTIPSQRTRELHEGGGECVECTVYYRDDDNNSGYGDNAQVAYWYGAYKDAPLEPADDSWMSPPKWSGIDEFDLACERRYD